MSFTVFLGNLPAWVTADDIRGWLTAENLVADAIKVIRNPETQESKGFAFIDAPNTEEMNAIIRRFDRAPLEDRLLRANPAQPPKPKGPGRSGGPGGFPPGGGHGGGHGGAHSGGPHTGSPHSSGQRSHSSHGPSAQAPQTQTQASEPATGQAESQRPPRRGKKSAKRSNTAGGPQSAFAEELAKVL
jgi:RNA recognition motif-containing protein